MLRAGSSSRRATTRLAWAGVDAAVWPLAVFAAVWLRYEFAFPPRALGVTAGASLVCALLQVGFGSWLGPYRIGHVRGSYEETFDLARSTVLTTLTAFVLAAVVRPAYLPRSAMVTGGALALLCMFAIRLLVRDLTMRRARVRPAQQRAVVFGAGDAGRRLVRNAVQEGDDGFAVVALLDDDPTKARLRVQGVPVRGTSRDLERVATQTDATHLILAASHAAPEVKRELHETARRLGLTVKVLPSLAETLAPVSEVRSLRDLDVADLLGRRPVHLDEETVRRQVQGSTVLVTGAGGSIGSELCRQLSRCAPGRLVLLDRDESGLQATQMSLTGSGLLDTDDIVLADIRDAATLDRVFHDVRPQLVFHAAALKHLPLLERYPWEAWATNVIGTANVLEAARRAGVDTFVNISTDKAAAPTCVLGYSKRLTERLTADYAARGEGRYVSVRFGNVLGSRGSVVHAFTAQIERGGPVTVTHPDVRRYFMLIPEACQLVLEAACIGADGEVMVLDMGEQVRIVDVARTLIEMSGRSDVQITYTGLREGEKLGEDLFGAEEQRHCTGHPLVTGVAVPPVATDDVRKAPVDDHRSAYAWMSSEGSTMSATTRGGVA